MLIEKFKKEKDCDEIINVLRAFNDLDNKDVESNL
jgi:hypothetical protein